MSEPQEREGQHRRDPDTPPDPAEPKAATKKVRHSTEYPLWFRMLIIAALTGGLLYQLFIRGDVATSLMLGGIIGAALGINEVVGSRTKNGSAP